MQIALIEMSSLYLSYFINEQTPLYGGEKSIFIEERSKITEGASSNTKYLKFPNHTGTHIDFQNHFSDSGKTINDYPVSFWKFNYIYILNYEVEEGEIINEKIASGYNIPEETDFLIIYIGFGKFRNNEIYWNNNPGLSPNLAKVLRSKCPNLRIVGFDFISVSSYQNRLLGRETHKEFLVGNDILLIEDMNLEEIKDKTIKQIVALPLLIDKIDGSPITIIAEYE